MLLSFLCDTTLTQPTRHDESTPASSGRDKIDYENALGFLYDRIDYERLTTGTSRYPFRLTRMRELLGRLGLGHFIELAPVTKLASAAERTSDIERASKPAVIHLAGTKGKGSTASMVAAALTAAGLKTGLYTSPHLQQLEERFRVDGQICHPNELISLVDQVRPVDEALMSDGIGAGSFFELTTALSLLHFHHSGCDAVVLETGLGGRLDSTNVCWPDVTAITSIGLDHQHVLGDTLAQIATEKAGIIKPGVPVISGVRADEPAEVIERIAAEKNSPLLKIGRDFTLDWQPNPVWGSQITFHGRTNPLGKTLAAHVAMEGEHQARNAAMAIAIVQVLRNRLPTVIRGDIKSADITDATIAGALANLRCDGRIQRYALSEKTTGIIDAAHNEDSIAALCQTLKRRATTGPVAIVFGTSIDKSSGPMLEQIAELAKHIDLKRIQITRFNGNPRWRPTAELMAQMPDSLRPIAVVNDDPIQACQAGLQAVTPGGMLIVCGSFFLAAETAPWMHSITCEATDAS
ncbi:bifunctional folylpolyglutamate synthase/dihydrofolate synthase [Rubripirellula reticaptiva]|uniref:Dihydrofolate synthase/folylpolyglutamate synthase n=1 Tax=Rubripirellula reticaptiva TaxID=2528013 RepID=A0A5C6FAQ8_9BACT|nr:Mur ligase family protein [Rubripirellula reticaptiva]TWU57620.1 Folylpolyglutamate synthase [Rubripirellula reticaptiva]